MSKPTVLLMGTCDTKLSEILYVRSQVLEHGVSVKLIDVGRSPVTHELIDYNQADLFRNHSTKPDLANLPRNEIIRVISSAASTFVASLYSSSQIFGAICIGGSGGTSLGASVMRAALPVSFPKLLVSTVASGDISSFVGETDITMMNSVVDIAGQNSILNPILENAAGMIAGGAMAHYKRVQPSDFRAISESKVRKKRIGITMFGVTTPAVDVARAELEEQGYEVFVFHATGNGGRTMEKLVAQKQIDGVLDLTTSELADELVGGIMTAGPNRLTAASKAGIPQLVSLGALDMVNFGPRSKVPAKFETRLLHEHNPDITVMRTSENECQILGTQIAEKLKTFAKRKDLIRVILPRGGVSMIAKRGGPFYDESADIALFEAVKKGLEGHDIHVVEDEKDINDSRLATEMAKALIELMKRAERSTGD